MRKGYALTAILLMSSIVLAITFSGIFDAATPRIQKADENTINLKGMLNEIRDTLNMLWIADELPSNKTLSLAEFKNLVKRDLWMPSIVKDLKLEFSDVLDGVRVLVTCELYEYAEIYPYKINIPGITVDGNEVRMLIQYRKGTVM